MTQEKSQAKSFGIDQEKSKASSQAAEIALDAMRGRSTLNRPLPVSFVPEDLTREQLIELAAICMNLAALRTVGA